MQQGKLSQQPSCCHASTVRATREVGPLSKLSLLFKIVSRLLSLFLTSEPFEEVLHNVVAPREHDLSYAGHGKSPALGWVGSR
jgi:hypothetical protein